MTAARDLAATVRSGLSDLCDAASAHAIATDAPMAPINKAYSESLSALAALERQAAGRVQHDTVSYAESTKRSIDRALRAEEALRQIINLSNGENIGSARVIAMEAFAAAVADTPPSVESLLDAEDYAVMAIEDEE